MGGKKKKRTSKNCETISKNIHIMGISEGEERGKGTQEISEITSHNGWEYFKINDIQNHRSRKLLEYKGEYILKYLHLVLPYSNFRSKIKRKSWKKPEKKNTLPIEE